MIELIGYPSWIEEITQLDNYYLNVSMILKVFNFIKETP